MNDSPNTHVNSETNETQENSKEFNQDNTIRENGKMENNTENKIEIDQKALLIKRRRNRIHRRRFNKARLMSQTGPCTDTSMTSVEEEGTFFKMGRSEMKGRRTNMEDYSCHIINQDEDFAYFAVFDGHAGDKSAKICSEILGRMLFSKVEGIDEYRKGERELKFMKDKIGFDTPEEEIIKILIRDSFFEMDNYLENEVNVPDGTTCSIIIIFNKKIYFANAGDSAIFGYKQITKYTVESPQSTELKSEKTYIKTKFTVDHNTKNEDEIKRLAELGKKVINGRLGMLNITRSLGSHGSFFKNVITPEPEIKVVPLVSTKKKTQKQTEKDENYFKYLVIASDGVWNYLDHCDIFKTLKENSSPKCSAEIIRDKAFKKGSNDNISVIVISFS